MGALRVVHKTSQPLVPYHELERRRAMAKIVLGMGTSHGPMLSTPPDQWGQRAMFDRGVRHHFKGRTWSFDELLEARKEGHFEREITPELWRQRHAACRAALVKLADVFAE